MRPSVWKGLGLGALVAGAAAGLLVLYAARYAASDRILPGVTVGGIPVGGLTRPEAERILTAAAGAGAPGMPAARAAGPDPGTADGAIDQTTNRGPRHIRLYFGQQEWDVGPAAPGPDLERSLAAALAVGRSGGPLARAAAFAATALRGARVPLYPATAPPVDLAPELAPIVAAVRQAPGETVWDPETGNWQPGTPGREVDVAATVAAMQAAAAASRPAAAVVVRPVEPRLSAGALGEYQVLARFETRVLQAHAGRLANISLAARRVSGTIIPPGGTFSFNTVVGPRLAELGWQPARELFQGEYITGYGGGICQVSSTLYNAALLAGLTVVERHHHSRPLSYVPLGQDATVAWDYLDLRFRNTGPGPVVVAAGVKSGNPQRIVVTLYGPWQPPAASLESVTEQYLPPEYREMLDPALPAGFRTVVDPGYEGYSVKVYLHSGGERRLVGRAHYQPRAGKVIVGTGGVRLPPADQQHQIR